MEIIKRNFEPTPGIEYENKGGGVYRCIKRICEDEYLMQNTKTLWTFNAHIITLYADKTIEWDYSTNGYFSKYEF